MTQTFVYFLLAEEAGQPKFIKIGWSKNPETRIESFRTGCPLPLRLLGKVRGGEEEERRLHGIFASRRERGEWFRSDDELQYALQALSDMDRRLWEAEAMAREGSRQIGEADRKMDLLIEAFIRGRYSDEQLTAFLEKQDLSDGFGPPGHIIPFTCGTSLVATMIRHRIDDLLAPIKDGSWADQRDADMATIRQSTRALWSVFTDDEVRSIAQRLEAEERRLVAERRESDPA